MKKEMLYGVCLAALTAGCCAKMAPFTLAVPPMPEIEVADGASVKDLIVKHEQRDNVELDYTRHIYTITAKDKPVTIKRITFFKDLTDAQVSGNTDGSVVITDSEYLGIEHPMSKVIAKPMLTAQWTPKDFKAAEQTIALPNVLADDTITVRFDYTKGPDRIDITRVALCDREGTPLVEDLHKGFAGIGRDKNVYTLKTPANVPADCSLRIDYAQLDRTQSFGTITVESKKSPKTISGWINRNFELPAGESWTFGVVIGRYEPGQLRRAFQLYLDKERAHPYRVFPHYNSWFHLGLKSHNNPDPMARLTEEKALKAMTDFNRELYTKRGVAIDSYLWDDGWDNWDSLWDYHKGFPKGFEALAAQAKAQNSGIGAWLSPWGGYNAAKDRRVANAKRMGLPTNAGGLSLAQKQYYEAFRDRCLQMIKDYNMNLFKFDGIGGGVFATGANDDIAPDLQGLVNHIQALRQAKPDVFINCTVGTWPSPFWVFYADSIWRGGSDWGTAGTGNKREQWITYRDDVIRSRFAIPCPLFPLNSIMNHGIIVTDIFGMPVNDSPEATTSFANEVWMGIASGSDLQEYYINPEMMSDKWWDILAEGVKWLRANEHVLRDTHWFGGVPAKGETYGYASWAPDKAVILVRNPSGKRVTWAGDIAATLEAPKGWTPGKATLRFASSGLPAGTAIDLTQPVTLEPYEVKLIEIQ